MEEDDADDIVTAIKKTHFPAPSVMRFDDDENRDDVSMLPSIKGDENMSDRPITPVVTNTDVLTQSNSQMKASSSRNGSVHGNGNDTTRSSTHSTERASFDRSSIKEEPLKELEGIEDKELKGHNGSVMCLIQLKDGRICSAGGSNDPTIKIWNKKNGSCEATLTGQSITSTPHLTICDTLLIYDPPIIYN